MSNLEPVHCAFPTSVQPGHVIKFGILGCAEIARKVSLAITLSLNSTLFAVASRSLDKARRFAAAANGFPPNARVYGSYEALLDYPEVDAVYVPLPTSLHIEWTVAAAEFDVIVVACERNGVQLMDGTMWMHHPRTARMKEFLRDGRAFDRLKADFVITCQEKEASFTTASGSWFDDLVTCWVPKPSEHLVNTDRPQEALMVKEFSSLVGGIKSEGRKLETKWPLLSRNTRLILDLANKLIENGFAPVDVVC